jgi:acyl-coenzyme A synthetase/AMP-(fatty) acid ligase
MSSSPSLAPWRARARLLVDRELGAGNFLFRTVAANPRRDQPFLFAQRPDGKGPDDVDAYSLSDLALVTTRRAGWLHAHGVHHGDPVAVYVGEGIEPFLQYLALTSLGAIPALVNGRMPADVAARYIAHVGAVGLIADPEQRRQLARLPDADTAFFAQLRFDVTPAEVAASVEADPKLPAIYPYQHGARDIVMLSHSSGTTGAPKAATFGHEQFFRGKRNRLWSFPSTSADRMLTTLPHSHSAGISYLMTATLLGLPTLATAGHEPDLVLPAMRSFQPTVVTGFPQTWIDLLDVGIDEDAARRVRMWINTGDSAHEKHVRSLVALGSRPRRFRPALRGSSFVDGLGSSEMGMALFRKVSTPDTQLYDRHVGSPQRIVRDVAVFDDEGRRVPDGTPGMLGVLTPTVTPGYWDDTERTVRSTFGGYWLTGDIVRRDAKGRYFHLDRVQDVIHGADGPIYSLPMEEVLLKTSAIADCAVVGVPAGRGGVDPVEVPVAMVRLRIGESASASALLAEANNALREAGLTQLSALVLADHHGGLPIGPTGKVLKRMLRERLAALDLVMSEGDLGRVR